MGKEVADDEGFRRIKKYAIGDACPRCPEGAVLLPSWWSSGGYFKPAELAHLGCSDCGQLFAGAGTGLPSEIILQDSIAALPLNGEQTAKCVHCRGDLDVTTTEPVQETRDEIPLLVSLRYGWCCRCRIAAWKKEILRDGMGADEARLRKAVCRFKKPADAAEKPERCPACMTNLEEKQYVLFRNDRNKPGLTGLHYALIVYSSCPQCAAVRWVTRWERAPDDHPAVQASTRQRMEKVKDIWSQPAPPRHLPFMRR